MKRISVFITFGFLIFSHAIAQEFKNDCSPKKTPKNECIEKTIQNKTTTFPATSNSPDYKVRPCQVKLAIPYTSNKNRIWVKGYSDLNTIQFFTGEAALTEPTVLQPPFYTAVIEISAEYTEVCAVFTGSNNDPYQIKVYPKNLNSLTQPEDTFSMLFYGCFQPFKVENGKGTVLYKDSVLNYVMRESFNAVANEKQLKYYSYETQKHETGALIQNPKIIIGTGDQIYTDAGYNETNFENHPLSAWAHKCEDPYPLLVPQEYEQHLNRCYTHFNSFKCFESAYAKLPSMNVWDDHEIRDGWGSHGDEYQANGELSDKLKPYYTLSRQAFIEHQFAVGPRQLSDIEIDENHSLEQMTRINGVSVFAFDLRSNRNSCEDQVISEDQMKAFKSWCQEQKSGEEVVIVSSIPIFYESNKVSEKIVGQLYEGELRDDIIDAWASHYNRDQRDEIIRELIKFRKRDVRPIIVSGDVHVGGMISTYYYNKESKRSEQLCYEFVFSGLSHEKLGEGRKGTAKIGAILQHKAEKPRATDPTIFVDGIGVYPIYRFTRSKLNFGGLEFSTGKQTTASLFIMGDNNLRVIEYELKLMWNETLDAHWDKMKKPFHWYFWPATWRAKRPVPVPYNEVDISHIQAISVTRNE